MLIYGVLNCKETRFGYDATNRMEFIFDESIRPLSLVTNGNYYISIGGLC